MKKLLLTLIKLGLFTAAISLLPWIFIKAFTANRIYLPEDVELKTITIVFGAGLRRDSTPTTVLQERIETAVDLYKNGKTQILLMSGDNRFEDYDEPTAMKNYAIQQGVPEEAIVLDFAGRNTYDTCYRANEIFGVEEAILVTQNFHLPRAIYLCEMLGIDAYGVSADHMPYLKRTRAWGEIREIFADIKAMWWVHVSKPLPVLGEPLPIHTPEEN